MRPERSQNTRRRRRRVDPRSAGVKLAIAAGVAVLAITAVVFSNSFATKELVDDGLAAQRVEAALGANDLGFKALGQSVLLAEDRALGVADDAIVAEAIAEARDALADLEIKVSLLADHDRTPLSERAYEAVRDSAEAVLAAAGSGDAPAASSILAGEAKASFEELRDVLAGDRLDHVDSLLNAGDTADRTANITRFLVAFLLPLGAIVAYRFAARRQLRMAEVQLDAQLAAEHEIHKAKDEFIASMSHELRTPLTSIYGFSELLIESGAVDPEMTLDLVEMINSESAELGRMVEDLLVSARAAANALVYAHQPVDVHDEVMAVLAPFLRSGHAIEAEVPHGVVHADPLRTRQIIRNLLSNALRHGGDQIRVEGRVDDEWVGVVVSDNGDGIPADMEPRLFSRFIHDGRDALAVGSVGLGLAVVKELATAMGGDVAYRRLGDRTMFEFWLPLAEPDLEALFPHSASPEHAHDTALVAQVAHKQRGQPPPGHAG